MVKEPVMNGFLFNLKHGCGLLCVRMQVALLLILI